MVEHIMHADAAVSHGGNKTAPTILCSIKARWRKMGCEETAQATVKKQRLVFAGLVARIEYGSLSKYLLFGELPRDKGTR